MNLLNTVTVNMNSACGTTIMLERRVEELSGLTEIASLFENICHSQTTDRPEFPNEICVKYNTTGGKDNRRFFSQESSKELANGGQFTGSLENVKIWLQKKLNNIKYDLYIYPEDGQMKRYGTYHLKKSIIKDVVASLKSRKRFKTQLFEEIKNIRDHLARKASNINR